MDAILVENLTKAYRSGWPWRPPTTVLSGVSFAVSRGEIFGFLGPNGSGKTTTLKILMGLTTPTAGKAEVLGRPLGEVAVRRQIGFLPEAPYFYDYLTAEEFLGFYGRLAGLGRTDVETRIDRLLDQVGLTEARALQLRKFSKGMLQRIGLAQALIHDPEVVILDEPMSGLDPLGRRLVRDLILSLREQGKTIFFSSHIIPDVEMICDRVGILVKGRLLAAGRVEELVSEVHTRSVEIVCEGVDAGSLPVLAQTSVRVVQRGRRCLIVLERPDQLEAVLQAIRDRQGTLISVTPQKASLEDLFLSHIRERTSE